MNSLIVSCSHISVKKNLFRSYEILIDLESWSIFSNQLNESSVPLRVILMDGRSVADV